MNTNRLNCKYPGESHTIYCNVVTVNCMGLSRILTVQAICVPLFFLAYPLCNAKSHGLAHPAHRSCCWDTKWRNVKQQREGRDSSLAFRGRCKAMKTNGNVVRRGQELHKRSVFIINDS